MQTTTIDFTATADLMEKRSKTVARLFGWWHLKKGDLIIAIKRIEGREQSIALLRVLSTRQERLEDVTKEECAKEGFSDLSPCEFVEMHCKAGNIEPHYKVNRVEFSYVEQAGGGIAVDHGVLSFLFPR